VFWKCNDIHLGKCSVDIFEEYHFYILEEIKASVKSALNILNYTVQERGEGAELTVGVICDIILVLF
jgi:hypothetical protein